MLARRARQHRECGLTLIEVMVTVAILTSLAMGSMLVIVPVARQTRLSKEVEIANTELRRVLEKVQAAPYNEVTTLYPDGTELPIQDLENGLITISYTDPTADPLFLRVSITWEGQDSGTYSRSFSTVRTE